jgi:hypothetical protein
MTRVHLAAGAAFRNAASRFQFEVDEGLVGAFLLGGSLGASIRNLTGGAPAEIVGTPTVNAGSLILGPGGYMQTQVPESTAQTILMVGKVASAVGSPSDKDCMFCSTNAGPAAADSQRTSNGASFYALGPSGYLRTFNARYTGGVQTSGTVTLGDDEAFDSEEWALYRTHFDSAGALLRDESGETEETSVYAVARDRTTNTYRIGMNYGSGVNLGNVEINQIHFFNRKLTDPAEIAAHIAQMRALAALTSLIV